MPFLDDLRAYGPGSGAVATREQARAYCAQLAATHYENFSVVTRLTPRELRPALESIYAFCRWSDDLGDEVGDRDRSRELLAWWRGELAAMYRGEPRHPVMLALEETVRAYKIPSAPFEALISAFEQDQEVAEYETDAQLRDYCTRSANPVGELVLYLARARTPENVRDSDAICTGLQLANFWQDVSRDLGIGRIYLPRKDRERFGVSADDLHARRFTPGFRDLLAFKVDQARALLEAGHPLADRLPRPFDLSVDLFARGGLAILKAVADRNYDVWERPALSKGDKVRLILRAFWSRRVWPKSRAAPARSAPAEAAP